MIDFIISSESTDDDRWSLINKNSLWIFQLATERSFLDLATCSGPWCTVCASLFNFFLNGTKIIFCDAQFVIQNSIVRLSNSAWNCVLCIRLFNVHCSAIPHGHSDWFFFSFISSHFYSTKYCSNSIDETIIPILLHSQMNLRLFEYFSEQRNYSFWSNWKNMNWKMQMQHALPLMEIE